MKGLGKETWGAWWIWWHRSIIDLFCFRFKLCLNCKSKFEYNVVVKDKIDYMVCEYEMRCKKCNSLEDYFAYGGFEREFHQHYTATKHPILSRLIGLLPLWPNKRG